MNTKNNTNRMTRPGGEPYLVSIVDDDQAVRAALGNLLESVGLAVESFASAEEFMNSRLVKRRSCLILDVQLPRTSGLELQQHLSSESDSIPIIFVTAHPDDDVRSRALQEGAIGFFNKPFDAAALLTAVRSTLK